MCRDFVFNQDCIVLDGVVKALLGELGCKIKIKEDVLRLLRRIARLVCNAKKIDVYDVRAIADI